MTHTEVMLWIPTIGMGAVAIGAICGALFCAWMAWKEGEFK